MVCRVEVNIQATAERIWSLLTEAKGFSRWNSTVTSIEGQIREGERLRLRVPGSDRIFTPVISGVIPDERMTWTGGLPRCLVAALRSADVMCPGRLSYRYTR